jgi:DNA mismatch repair protein MutL
LLPIGRYPIVFLSIKMDPLLVDVNVHPSKLEVRLSKEAELFSLIEEHIRGTFKRQQLIPEVTPKKKMVPVKEEQQQFMFEYGAKREDVKVGAPVYVPSFVSEPIRDMKGEQACGENESLETAFKGNPTFDEPVEEMPSSILTDDLPFGEEPEDTAEEVKTAINNEAKEQESRVPPMYPIGQMHGTYILAQNEKGLYIIDQHAAQERIKYEYFRDKLANVEAEVQELLMPITLEYSANEWMIIEEHKEELAKVGVFLEPFGHNSYIVRSHPQWFPKGEEKEVIKEMIQQVLTMRKVNILKLREEAAIMMSCKGSIKANHHLREDEIFALLESLRNSSDPFTCPHGRPIIVHYSTYEMEKMFKRVM